MHSVATLSDRISFGPFSLWPKGRVLKRGQETVRIGDRAFGVLLALLEQAGTTQSHETLTRKVWNRQWLDESNLRVAIAAIRKALGEPESQYILTIPGQGYCFSPEATVTVWSSKEETVDTGPAALWDGLVARPTRLFGRDEDSAAVRQLLKGGPLVTLTGPGGVGKTALALSVVHSLADSHTVRFVDLSAVACDCQVAERLAAVLGPVDGLRRHDKPMLLLLDNCEHVAEAVAEATDQILSEGIAISVLATSREPLRTPYETVYRLRGLDWPSAHMCRDACVAAAYPAVAFFLDRMRAACPAFHFNDRVVRQSAELCGRLDGMPLALEFAAVYAVSIGLDTLADGLDDRFRILTRGYRTAPDRHKSLQAAIGWSYDLLSEREQILFRHLALLPDSFSLDAAARLLNLPEPETAALIAALVDKSLVMTAAPCGGTSYYLLETLRAFAHDRLVEAGETERPMPRVVREKGAGFGQLLAPVVIQGHKQGAEHGTRLAFPARPIAS